MTLRVPFLSAVAATTLVAAASMPARASVEAGNLSCHSPGAVGFIVGAVLNFDCLFVDALGRPHHYVAMVRRVGLDLGFTQNVALGWVVFAPTAYIQPGDLAGNYGGVQAGATVGIGLGANAMIGGSNNSIALQPVSAQAQAGLSVEGGLTGMELRPAVEYEGPRYRRIAVTHYHSHHHVRHHRT
jgi:hypothetical protein